MNEVQEWQAYCLDEAAIKSGLSEKELLRKAAAGELALWVWCGEKSPLLCLDGKYVGWFEIPSDFIPDIINGLVMCVDRLLTEDGVEVLPAKYYFENVVYRSEFMSIIPGSKEPAPEMDAELVSWAIPMTRKDIRIFPDDLSCLNATYTVKNDSHDDKLILERNEIASPTLIKGVKNMCELLRERLGIKVDRKTFKKRYFGSKATWELGFEERKKKPMLRWSGYDDIILKWAQDESNRGLL